MRAHLLGVTFDGDDGPSPYTITSISGWLDGVSTRLNHLERPTQHGEFDLPGYLSGRLITISGEIYTANDDEQQLAADRLTGLLADGGFADLVVDHTGRTLEARVQRSGTPVITVDRWGLLAKYELELWAPDPRKYGQLNTFGPASTVQVFHRGNFPALSTLTITGSSAGGYTMTGPGGRKIIVTRALAASAPHVFEMRTGRLSVGGVRVLGGVSRADLFAIPPGLPVTTISVSAGAQVQVDVKDTFV